MEEGNLYWKTYRCIFYGHRTKVWSKGIKCKSSLRIESAGQFENALSDHLLIEVLF